MYQKNIENGYIVSIASGIYNGNITEDEYDNILGIIRSKPTAPEGFDYRLKADLTWELYELPVVEEAEDENEEITLEDALAKLRELGVEV